MRTNPGTRILLPLAPPILQTALTSRPPDFRGKVRDIYQFGDRLLIVATDRISAFDYVLGSGIPDKGRVLTQISGFWFTRTQPIVANHIVITGNTAVDAQQWSCEHKGVHRRIEGRGHLLVTVHRRESWGNHVQEVCRAIATCESGGVQTATPSTPSRAVSSVGAIVA